MAMFDRKDRVVSGSASENRDVWRQFRVLPPGLTERKHYGVGSVACTCNRLQGERIPSLPGR